MGLEIMPEGFLVIAHWEFVVKFDKIVLAVARQK